MKSKPDLVKHLYLIALCMCFLYSEWPWIKSPGGIPFWVMFLFFLHSLRKARQTWKPPISSHQVFPPADWHYLRFRKDETEVEAGESQSGQGLFFVWIQRAHVNLLCNLAATQVFLFQHLAGRRSDELDNLFWRQQLKYPGAWIMVRCLKEEEIWSLS